MKELKPTEEQKRVIRRIGEERYLKIEAFAGTGKTTTLELVTKAYPFKRFLVLAFNRAVAEELQGRMGRRECPPKCVKIKPKGGWTHETEI
ncbi:AAA family ATPase [Desulfurobacterium crinifex]